MNTWRSIIAPALLTWSTAAAFGCSSSGEDQEGDGGGGHGAASGTGGSNNGSGGGRHTDPACVPGVPKTSQIPRLTQEQYDNTIRDLVGVDSTPSSMLAPDSDGSVGQQAWDGYKTAAQALAAAVVTDAGARAKVLPCTPDADGAACAAEFVDTFGPRAFRRPLVPAERERFLALYEARSELTEQGTFDEGLQLLLEVFLLSPSFLMRAEIAEQAEGEYFRLTSHEVASRLSYLLWQSMPDDELFRAATADELSTPEQIREQAMRMLADPKSRAMVGAFHAQYLHMGPGTRWTNVQRDPEAFPDFDEAIVPLLSEETERFIEHVVFDRGGSFQDLLTTPIGFVNASTAPLYDLSPADYASPELVPVDLDPDTRAGLFTRLGFLMSHSSYDRTSPILRGAFLQKEVLCTDIPAPPMMAEGTPLPMAEGLTTNRLRVDEQTKPSQCAFCHHSYINPTGYALEAYDAVGAYQTMESFSGAPIDTKVSVDIGGETLDVSGPVELSQAIADSPAAHKCYARKWVKFAYKRDFNSEDACTVDELSGKLTAGGYTVLDLIADLTQSQSFQYRAVETEVAP